MADKKEPKKITEPFGFVGGQMLTDILAKGPDAITEDERDILRARKSYLTDEQVRKFEVEKQVEPEPEPEPESEPENKPEPEPEPEEPKKKKRGRK